MASILDKNSQIACKSPCNHVGPLGEPERDKGETEEPKICTPKQFEFNWAHNWLEESEAPILDEVKAQGLLSQVFWFSQASFSPILVWYFVFPTLASVYVLKSTSLSIFSGFASTVTSYFPEQEADCLRADGN